MGTRIPSVTEQFEGVRVSFTAPSLEIAKRLSPALRHFIKQSHFCYLFCKPKALSSVQPSEETEHSGLNTLSGWPLQTGKLRPRFKDWLG